MDDIAELATLASLRSNPIAETNHVEVQALGDKISDLIEAAQHGDLASMKSLVADGTSVNQLAEDGTTALHWAASNNFYEICVFLLEKGADVNARGGFQSATPLMWASRNGFVYIARLLLQHGAVYNEVDEQGFNPLHLAVHSSNVLLVIYYVHEYASYGLDTVDTKLRRTPLIWAACQGDHMTVDVLVKAGADVHSADAEGMTPLHWATVAKSLDCLHILLKAGADPTALNSRNSSCFDIAKEIDGERVLKQALARSGRLPSGAVKIHKFTDREAELITFFLPFVMAKLAMLAVSYLSWFWSVPLLVLLLFISRLVLKRFVLYNKWPGHLAFLQSTIMSGIFCGLTFWVLVQFITDVLPLSYGSHNVASMLFLALAFTGLTCYFAALFMDPGIIKTGSEADISNTINKLLDSGEYDTLNFCYATFVRIPARAHYDKIIGDVVARYDHYCPWLYNAVGLRNHRLFVAFLTLISLAITTLSIVVVWVIRSQPTTVMQTFSKHPQTTALYMLCAPIFVWIEILTFMQWLHVARASTTYDIAQGKKGKESFSSLPADHPLAKLRARNETPAVTQPSDNHNHKHNPLAMCAAVLGLQQIKVTFRTLFGKDPRPYDHGLKANCSDFWFGGGPLFNPDARLGTLNGQLVDYFSLNQLKFTKPATLANRRADNALRRLT